MKKPILNQYKRIVLDKYPDSLHACRIEFLFANKVFQRGFMRAKFGRVLNKTVEFMSELLTTRK
jgi:hypothetical protein